MRTNNPFLLFSGFFREKNRRIITVYGRYESPRNSLKIILAIKRALLFKYYLFNILLFIKLNLLKQLIIFFINIIIIIILNFDFNDYYGGKYKRNIKKSKISTNIILLKMSILFHFKNLYI